MKEVTRRKRGHQAGVPFTEEHKAAITKSKLGMKYNRSENFNKKSDLCDYILYLQNRLKSGHISYMTISEMKNKNKLL